MINPLSAKVERKVIGSCVIKDEAQGWNEEIKVVYMPDAQKARAYEIGNQVYQQILSKPPRIAALPSDIIVTCSEKDAQAAAFVSVASLPDPSTGDKYEVDQIITMMFVSDAIYRSVYEAYWLICRNGLSTEEFMAQYASDVDDEPPKA